MKLIRFTKNRPEDYRVTRIYGAFNEQFWKDAREYLQSHKDDFIEVSLQDTTVYAYMYEATGHESDRDRALEILESVEKIPVGLSDIYPKVQVVVLYGFNEYAYRLMNIFTKTGIKILLVGKMWKLAGYEVWSGDILYPDYSILNVYCEGTQTESIIESFNIMLMLAYENQKYIFMQIINRFVMSNINFGVCLIPDNIDYHTKEENTFIVNGKSLDEIIQKASGPERNDHDIEIACSIYNRDDVKTFIESHSCIDNKGYKIPEIGVAGKCIVKPDNKRKVYLIGPCIVDGVGVSPSRTLLSYLQNLLDQKYPDMFCVIGISVYRTEFEKLKEVTDTIPIKNSDIVLFVYMQQVLSTYELSLLGDRGYDATEIYSNVTRPTMCGEIPIHTNAAGNRLIAQGIMNNIFDKIINTDIKKPYYIQKGEIVDKDALVQINDYIVSIDKYVKKENCGAIVMNCNPFTYGHQYLVERAAAQVDWLYILVVQEDKSYFSFKDRYQMVKDGIKNIHNVIVIPSGKFILSYETMPDYFRKTYIQEKTVDATQDLELFCRHIAPALNIKIRFVGEEPIDRVTKQYNDQMKDILDMFDIDCIEIPRKKYEDNYISASIVRKLIEEKAYEALVNYIPESTYMYLKKIKLI